VKKRHEEDMYPAVKRFFSRELRCKHIAVDLPDQKKVHLPRNLGTRDPDVLGVTEDGEVAVAEGKLLAVTGQPFEQCVQQVDSLRSFADHLYVFFPESDWGDLSKEDAKEDIKVLRDKKIGLILVDENGKYKVRFKPPNNDTVEEAKRVQVKELMGLTTNDRIPRFEGLDPLAARKANAILCGLEDALIEVVQTAVGNVFKNAKKKRGAYQSFDARQNVFRWYVCLPGDIVVEIEPFGTYLDDGQPCIWISKQASEEFLKKYLEDEALRFGTHVFFCDENENVPRADVTAERIARCVEQESSHYVCHKVDISERSKSGLRREMESLLRQCKKLE